MKEPIRVWKFEDAPKEYKDLSTNGGDEDWVVFVPKECDAGDDYQFNWIQYTDTCNEPAVYKIKDGTIYIGAHA